MSSVPPFSEGVCKFHIVPSFHVSWNSSIDLFGIKFCLEGGFLYKFNFRTVLILFLLCLFLANFFNVDFI